jgi:outer membrane protein assembly factor BamB
VAVADDWPQWRGPGRDNKVKDFAVPTTWPKALAKKWQTPVGVGDASPVLAGGKVYAFGRVGDDEVTTCLDADTGKVVWQDKYAAVAVTGAPGSHPGPRATPTVAEGKVCMLGVGGVISCLDAATGKVAWRHDTKSWPTFFTSSSPIIVDGMCIAQLGTGMGKGGGKGGKGGKGGAAPTGAPVEGGAYDLATGALKWKWPAAGPAYASPVLMTVGGVKQIVSLTERSVVGIGLDGKLLWETPFQAKYNSVTPIIDGETVIYAGQGSGTFAIRIEKTGDTFAAKPLWKVSTSPHQYNTPTLKDGRLYGLNASRNFYCMDAKTGEVIWTDLVQRGECGAVLDAGPVMLALTSDTNLVAFKPGTKEYEEIVRIKVADSPTWAVPIVTGNRVFVKDRDSVSLLTFE